VRLPPLSATKYFGFVSSGIREKLVYPWIAGEKDQQIAGGSGSWSLIPESCEAVFRGTKATVEHI